MNGTGLELGFGIGAKALGSSSTGSLDIFIRKHAQQLGTLVDTSCFRAHVIFRSAWERIFITGKLLEV